MAPTIEQPLDINIPSLPAQHDQFVQYVAAHPEAPMIDLLEPYKQYDTGLRKVFAQQPDHPAAQQPNVVPVFSGQAHDVKIRARNPSIEPEDVTEKYIMPLRPEERKAHGMPAIVQSLQEFRTNFAIFSESSLADMDWSNVVVAGSAVVTSMLSVPKEHSGSKKALREYYHETLAPASDVDLFLYGLTEEQAVEKIKQIEQKVRDALLVETTTIRTKHAITIVSQYPTRHVQIVLRIYKSISEILTGFDVDCSCAAYDGKQVWASPRALAAYMTQTNTIDLTRRSPSYENRLSKYRNRGFEVYWPHLERSRIDPTIFERSFARTEGLARLLILEKLPKNEEREAYIDKRRAERGRPAANRSRQMKMWGNIKDKFEDEVAEWVDEEDVSNYHTFTVPYGPKFHAKKIEKLLFTKDLLMNSEWNKPKDREVNLHRHPAFFGTADDVMGDCCGYCPEPSTVEEEEVAEEEGKIYVRGGIKFIKDDAGRQTIGSFHPLCAEDYTEMAYVGNTQLLCQAIVDQDVEYVRQWLAQEGNDPNTRDYTGRAPLHLAVSHSSLEVVQCLIDGGARLVARLVDGKTALHLAAIRGDVEIVSALLRKSEANEEEEEAKVDARRKARKADKEGDVPMSDSQEENAAKGASDDEDIDMMDDAAESENMDATTENSMVNIKKLLIEDSDKVLEDEDDDEPDVYDVNVLGWDIAASPLHFAIAKGHTAVVKCLVQDFGADVLLPVKLMNDYDRSAAGAILTLVLALQLPLEQAKGMTETLFALGASSAQADVESATAFQYCVGANPDLLDTYFEIDATGVGRAMKHVTVSGLQYHPHVGGPLMLAIQNRDSLVALRLLAEGVKPEITFDAFMRGYLLKWESRSDSEQNKATYNRVVQQPTLAAVECELPLLAVQMLEHGADPNTLTKIGREVVSNIHTRRYNRGESLLDCVRAKIQNLHEWKPEPQKHEPPTPLEDDATYLSQYAEGSYARWSANEQLRSAKEKYEREWNSHVKNVKASREQKGWEEKQAAVFDLLDAFRKLETVLVAKSAKTFKELHPDIEEPEPRQSWNYGFQQGAGKQDPFKITFAFVLPDVSDEAHARYMKLFEAAWQGDAKTVKELALLPWKNSEGETRPPLKIAVNQREQSLSPFVIAVICGHRELAKVMMEIAKAQYAAPDAPKQRHYRIANGDEDEDDEGDGESGDEIALAADVVDDQFTLENIGEIDVQVKSNIQPVALLRHFSNFLTDLADGSGRAGASSPHAISSKRTNTGSLKALKNMVSPDIDTDRQNALSKPSSLLQHAIYTNDLDLLSWIIDLGEEYAAAKNAGSADCGEDNNSKVFSLGRNDFDYAIQSGHCQILAEVIKRTGAGIPIDHFVQKSGVEVMEKPKYYQGLSVHGRKRKDWADAGRDGAGYEEVYVAEQPPLLKAAHEGSLEVVEWFLSDTPLRCYKQFSETHSNDKRLQRLAQAQGGFSAFVKKFLSTRAKLAMHCVIMGRETPESLELLKYLTDAMPEALEAKNKEGLTPLHIAFQQWRLDSAKILLAAGADQTVRDKEGRNLLHHILHVVNVRKDEHLERLRAMIELIDKRLLPSMFLERCALDPGSLTPVALCAQQGSSNFKYQGPVLDMLLGYSKGVELDLITGEGDTLMHFFVRNRNTDMVRVLLVWKPELVNRENAVGRTPFEMAEDSELSALCGRKPSTQRHWQGHRYHSNVVDMLPEEFIEAQRTVHPETMESLLDVVREAKLKLEAEGKGQRKLVTLNEANEVARRLAASKSSRVGEKTFGDNLKDEYEEEEAVDEVQLWLGRSSRRYSP